MGLLSGNKRHQEKVLNQAARDHGKIKSDRVPDLRKKGKYPGKSYIILPRNIWEKMGETESIKSKDSLCSNIILYHLIKMMLNENKNIW